VCSRTNQYEGRKVSGEEYGKEGRRETLVLRASPPT
jgi:hypothetical protein